MEFISFAIPFAALVFLTVIVGGLMNYYMDQRGLAFNPYLTYLLLPAIVGALYFVGGFSMWTVKGIVLALILLRASVQDLSERKADEFLWVMLLILALVNYKEVGVTSMLFGALGVTKNARKRVETENESRGITLLRNRVKCGECGYPMVRHTNSKYRIRESWTCQNPECGCKVRILDSHLLEKINMGINRIIENNELMIPPKRTVKATTPAVEELQSKINQELSKEKPNEEYIVSLVSDMASQLYRETDAKLMIAARVARQRASMMVQQDEFAPDYFTDLISYVTLDGDGKVRLITKTETVIEEGRE